MKKVLILLIIFASASIIVFAENETDNSDGTVSKTICLNNPDKNLGLCSKKVDGSGWACVETYALAKKDCYSQALE